MAEEKHYQLSVEERLLLIEERQKGLATQLTALNAEKRFTRIETTLTVIGVEASIIIPIVLLILFKSLGL